MISRATLRFGLTLAKLRSLPRLAIAALLGAAIAVPATTAAEGYKLIVHSSNPTTSLSREQVARYFLRKVAVWPAKNGVTPVDLDKDSATRAAFSREVLRKSVAEVTSYWQQQIFSGRTLPPLVKRSAAEVVAFVESNEGAIGYVAESAAVGNAKVVQVVE
jgi:ABC-type phosphate transport system substrate-binding protein